VAVENVLKAFSSKSNIFTKIWRKVGWEGFFNPICNL